MTSMELWALSQSAGTVHDVPDVRKIVFSCDAVTLSDAVQLVLPPGPAAVAVYVVSLDGDTVMVPWPTGVLLPMPLSILMLVAPVVSHVSVEEPPADIDVGDRVSVHVGCGAVTERKSGPAYQRTPGFALAGVMRRDAGLAADYAQRHGVARWFDDADALIHDPDIDAVYIATPPDTHCHYALKVAAAGKPCCVEKPMAPSHAQCLEMLAAFERAQQPLFVAYYRRSLPRFEQVRQWLAEGRIGTARHIHWQLARAPGPDDLQRRYRWRTDARIAPGGYFDDLGSHGLNLFSHFFGEVAEVSGSGSNQQGLYSACDAVAASWRWTSWSGWKTGFIRSCSQTSRCSSTCRWKWRARVWMPSARWTSSSRKRPTSSPTPAPNTCAAPRSSRSAFASSIRPVRLP